MKRLVGLVVLALAVGLLVAAREPSPAAARSEAPTFTPTLTSWQGEGLQRATLTVPLDYANPDDGRTVKLAVSRLRAEPTAGAYAGAIVLNPGGPGGSGLELPFYRDFIPGTVAERYDWVGFDPRGVGASVPSLHCNPRYFGANRPSFVPRTKALRKYWVARTTGYAKACGASAARGLLPFMSTRDTARDLESLRAALQAEAGFTKKARLAKLNYYGFSYGTYLGAVYASLYPTKVGRFVLDGVVDPTRHWYASNLDQSIAFDKNLNRFFAWVARRDRTYHLGTTTKKVRAGYEALLKRLDAKPAAGGRLGPDELGDALLTVAYDVSGWAGTAYDYADLVRRNQGSAIYAQYAASTLGAQNENAYAVYLAVQCTDQRSPAWEKFTADAARLHAKYPYMAWNNTWYNMPCRTWPAPARGKVAVSGAALSALGARVLLVNETYDGPTPFSGALTLRGLFPTASLIEGVGGGTHSGSLRGVPCVENRIAAYLATGAVPPRLSGRRADLRCPATQP